MAADQQVSHSRTLTVGETFQRRTHGESAVPFIRLSGKWLAEAGFRVGDAIRVSVMKDHIVLDHPVVNPSKKQANSNLVNKFD